MVKCTYLPSLEKCLVRSLENGYFSRSQKNVYKEGERAKYVCNDDFRTEHEGGEVTCTKDDWSPPPRCIRESECACILLRFLAKTSKSIITSPTLIHHLCLVALSLGDLQLKHNDLILSTGSCSSHGPERCWGQSLYKSAERSPIKCPYVARSDLLECKLWDGSHLSSVVKSCYNIAMQ